MAKSSDLIAHYERTHKTRVYGTSSVKHLRFLRPWIKLRDPKSILDYGCGQSVFLDVLGLGGNVVLGRYDPAIPSYAERPGQVFDLLVSIDVLEHIEEADVPKVLQEMRECCREALIVIDTRAAKHTLPDGRNAHVTLKSHDWWREALSRHFNFVEPIPAVRGSRAAFKTWPSNLRERARYHLLRSAETIAYYARRLVGRHKSHWKVSTTAKNDAG